jgi:hypothetical protein
MKHSSNISGDGYLTFILPSKKNVRIGTQAEMYNLIAHVRKGCLCDPFSMGEINVRLDDTSYPDYMRGRGTSQGESTNRLFNLLVSDLATQSADLGDKRLWIRITRYNLAKDEKLKNVLGIAKPRTLDWYVHEAALRRYPALSVYQDYVFPPRLADDDFEPIGMLYGRHKDMERVQQQRSSLLQLSSSRISADK